MDILTPRPTDDISQLIHKTPHQQPLRESYTKAKIEQGLQVVADHLASKGLDVSVVAVGGAVNTLLLRSRASTYDVDLFYCNKDWGSEENGIMYYVVEGGKLAEVTLRMSDRWLDNHSVVFPEDEMANDLYIEAIQQDEKVFSANGLTVYAAPWYYALATKVERAGKSTAKPYDMADALDYLARVIRLRPGEQAVKKSELRDWAVKFDLDPLVEEVMDALAKDYKAKNGQDGIVDG